MEHSKFIFVLLLCVFLKISNCEVNPASGSNSFEIHRPEINAAIDYLNSAPVKVYHYKQGVLINAHKKADITELSLDVHVDCINNYPNLPCNDKILICNAFVQKNAQGVSTVLGDVNCKPKPQFVVEDIAGPTEINNNDNLVPEIKQSETVALSNEAVSSEVGEHFIAVRKDLVPCTGCPFDLNPHAEGVDELVDLALKHVESEKSNKHILVKVLKLQQQIVSGVKYILLVEIAPTICAKKSAFNLNSCPVDANSKSLTCQITYLQKPWINTSKHVISNNCTLSQEFVIADDVNNEIDTNNGGEIKQPGNKQPNSDGMTPSRLSDLESQILLGVPDDSSPERPKQTIEPNRDIGLTSYHGTEIKPNSEEARPVSDEDLPIIEEFIAPATADSNIFQGVMSPNPSVIYENRPWEDYPSTMFYTQAADDAEFSQPPTTIIFEERYTEDAPLSTEQHEMLEDILSTIDDFQSDAPAPETETSTTPKSALATEIPNSSEESKGLSEEIKKPSEEKSLDQMNKSDESNSNSSSSEETNNEKGIQKRAIRQLEKITPDEKSLVKHLADYAAVALDHIDDDNHRRVVLQILGAKKMIADDGVYYHLILRMGISKCLEDKAPEVDENCRDKLMENYTKICKVQIHVNDEFGSPKVVKSQCQSIKRDKNDSNRTNYSRYKRSGLKGAPKEISKSDSRINQFVLETLAHLDSVSASDKRLKPTEILSATSQVVAGALYKIKVKVSLSDCKKVDQKELDKCDVLNDSSKICEIEVWEKLWEHFRQHTVKCEGEEEQHKFEVTVARRRRSLGRGIPGGEFEVSNDKIYEYLNGGLNHLDSQSQHKNKYKVHEVLSATQQIVSGSLYRIKAKVVLSDCLKTASTEREKCNKLESAEPKVCDFKIWDQPWLPSGRQTNITCESTPSYSYRQKRDVSYHLSPHLLGKNDVDVHFSMFNEFIKKYEKAYLNKKEFKYRFKVFSDNMKHVRLLNTYEQGTAKYGVTQFADLTRKEFSHSLGLRTDLTNENDLPFPQAKIPDVDLPAEFDWRTKGVVSEVKNQQQCGSCWAFSVTGNVEGQYALKYGNLLEFSEQELVDCDTEDQGCNGGLMDTAYRVIEKIGGLETEQDYPYDAEDEKCHFNRSLARVRLSGALNISQDETDMAKWLVGNGPISIAINANAMQFYMGGVSHPFKFLCDPKSLDHGVLIVGYGVHTYPLFKKSLPYWIVKNSWGTSWGEQGYYRVYRGDGTCGVNQTPSSAIVA